METRQSYPNALPSARPRAASLYSKPMRTRPTALQGFNLSDIRVVQRNLVYLIGLSPELADEQLLEEYGYIGQYGPTKKVKINKTKAYNHSAGLSYSAYITFTCEEDSAKCIKALTGFKIDGRELSATYGTTKYCSYFLKNTSCPKAECLYLHEFGSPEDSLTREDIKQSSNIAPSNSLLKAISIMVKPPDNTVFPPAIVLRLRGVSLDLRQTQSEAGSPETPKRKNSRYNFVEESEETPGEVPPYIDIIMQTNSPLKETATVEGSSISTLLDINSQDRWFADLIEPCDTTLDTVIVRAKTVPTH